MGNISYSFDGRTAFVTGAGQGIGREIAEMFVGAGANVAVIDWNQNELERAWGNSGERVLPLVVDVADSEQVDAATSRVRQHFDRLDILVNNAGIVRDAVSWKMTNESWDSVIAVHLRGTFNAIRAAIPDMRESHFGRIINVTSYTGMHGNVGQSNYAAAKAGIIGLTKTIAKEVARFGITVNAVSPNALTPMVEAIPKETFEGLTQAIPMGRFGEPKEMAPVFGFLATEEAGYITGAVVPVDGGISM